MGSLTEPKVGFIGAGKMASALAHGLIANGFTKAANITASDVVKENVRSLSDHIGVAVAASNQEVFERSTIVLLCVKPQQMPSLLEEIASSVTADHLIISIAAGVTLTQLISWLGEETRVVRVMPNTPCLVGKSASGFALGKAATPEDAELVTRLLSSVGLAVQVSESLMDAVTGLSGSGPAYVYQFIEALSDGGVSVGLPRPIATQLAAQTVLGAAQMVLQTGMHPGELKDAVCSPAGTTIAGVKALETGGLRGTVMEAVSAATKRARELADGAK